MTYLYLAIWLSWWSSANATGSNTSVAERLSVYASLGVLTLLLVGLASW
jgi:hypothetical protein